MLRQAGRDLLDRRCTFGTESEAPAVPRAAWLQNRLNDGVRGDHLARRLRARLLGQDAALGEVLERLSLEVVGQLPSRPIRLLLAGPTGCGKSMACKIVAETLDLPYHYIDAASFDSPYAVRASLAGAATGIVGSQNDGRLARIARRPAVVEVADLDHAPDHVRADLCDFFLRILEEGTLQTGTGRIVRTCPQLLFMFTSNVAYGTDNATVRVGFAKPSRNQVREWVIDRVVRHLGHAFFSRVGEPCMFDEFTTEAASAIAAMEIRALVGRVLQVERVEVAEGAARQVVADMPSLEGGARRVIDAAKRAVVPALKKVRGKPAGVILVRGQGGQLVVETAGEGRHEAARTPDGSSGRRR
ncbi:MAG: hypothetical protein AMS14_09670 [Planctomycetes bacterium DG_20]|nr:MAG: hypothetical protein AMS14_09670 [Planctomycetes bacterium DG_20]